MLAYRVLLAGCALGAVAYAIDGDGWRALGLLAAFILALLLRRELTERGT